jgi:hypothetical protein
MKIELTIKDYRGHPWEPQSEAQSIEFQKILMDALHSSADKFLAVGAHQYSAFYPGHKVDL